MIPLRLLIAEDSDDDFLLIQQALKRHGLEFDATRITAADQLRTALNSADWDIILCDYSMLGFDALEALAIIRATELDIPVIIVSGTIGEEVAVETLKQGANDYILKQNLTRLGPAVEHELRDANERRQRRLVEAFSTGQGEVLELILENRPLPEILGHIARRIESLPLSANRPLCSIFLINPERSHLTLGAAPNLPEKFAHVLTENPLPLQDGMGTSALAARRRETIVTEDITSDPNWNSVRQIAIDFGLRSCWSVPVFSSDRDILGTVAVYHLTPRHPEEGELKWVTAAVKLVTLAVERSRTAQALREYQDRIRATFAAAGAGIAITTADGRYIMANPTYCSMLGYTEPELCGMDFPSVTHPEDRSQNLEWITKLLAGEIDHFTLEKRCLHKNGSVVWVRASVSLARTADGRPPNIIAVTEDITPRKQTEEKLRHSEALLKIAGQAAQLGGWEVDLTNNRVYWSDEVCAIHDEPPGTQPRIEEGIAYYAPECRARLREVFTACINQGTPYDEELQIVTARGRRVWVRTIGRAVPDEQGVVTRVRGAFQDITEKKESAEETRRLARRLATTLESITNAFFTLDHDWKFTYVNQEAERLLRRNRGELLGRNVWDEFPEARDTTFELAYRRALREDVSVGFDEYFEPLNTWFEVRAYPSEEGLAVYFHDITERKKAESRLAEQAALLDKAQDAILVRKLDGTITFWNKSAERLYGWTADEATGTDVRHLIYHSAQTFDQAEKAVLDEGEWSGEFHQVTKDGDQILVESRWSLVTDSDGRPTSILDVNTDITERKKLEQQFLRAQRMEGIGTLAGGIAHDLNNILSPILMATELLRQGTLSRSDLEIVDTIESSAQRGADIVRQVLTFARGTPGDRIPIPPEHVINDVVRIIAETFPKNIQVEVEIQPGIRPILGDPTQINQVLLNLCINARDAMPDGGTLRIAAANLELDEHLVHINRQGSAGPHIVIEVEDTGTGISDELLPKIFDPFFTTKEPGKGTGLGLATVMSILKGHGGFATLDSEIESGSVFKLYFPVATDCEPTTADRQPAILPRGSGECILVIDDEAAVRTITRQTLKAFGYRVHLASNGAEGVKTFKRHRKSIDLVLTDMMMPVMDGATTIEEIRKESRGIPIIAASGLSSREKTARNAANEPIFFLRKPYTAAKLLDTLHEALKSRESSGV